MSLDTDTYDWNVRDLTDGQMIQMMARENGEAYKTDPSVLRETITATLQALGEGKIKAEELPVPPDTRQDHIRYAPGFGRSPVVGEGSLHCRVGRHVPR
jgi:hypothetical protein